MDHKETLMFNTLPKPIQKEVLKHLKNDDFRTAKRIYDEWLKKQKENATSTEH